MMVWMSTWQWQIACLFMLALVMTQPLLGAAKDIAIQDHRTCVTSPVWRASRGDNSSQFLLDAPISTSSMWVQRNDSACVSTSAPCYLASNAVVDQDTVELHVNSNEAAAVHVSVPFNWSEIERTGAEWRVHVQLPASIAQASRWRMELDLGNRSEPAMPCAAHMFVQVDLVGEHVRSFLVGTSQSSWTIEWPCKSDFRHQEHEVRLRWDAHWLRWLVDGVLVHEVPWQCTANDVVLPTELGVSHAPVFEVQSRTTTSSEEQAPVAILRDAVLESFNRTECKPLLAGGFTCQNKIDWKPRLGSNGGHLSLEEVYAFVNETASNWSEFTVVEEIGRSLENRSILALCVGLCNASSSSQIPTVLYTGMHHSREPISMMNLVYTVDLLRHAFRHGDLEVLELLFTRQLWFIFVVNPDGYVRNEEQKTWQKPDGVGQRKNTRPGCHSILQNGVDLNRNYATCFSQDLVGSSTDICGEDYRGAAPFSEPETLAIKDFVEKPNRNISVALNYHSFGRYFNMPFSCKIMGHPQDPFDHVFQTVAGEMTRYNNFQYGQSWADSNLYSVNGETSDWMWQAHGIIAMSPETGPGFDVPTALGFWPHQDDIPSLSTELYHSNIYAARVAGPLYEIVLDDVFEDSDGTVKISAQISNRGLRQPSAGIEVIALHSLEQGNGGPLARVAPNEMGSLASNQSIQVNLELPILPHASGETDTKKLAPFILLRDSKSCSLYRLSLAPRSPEMQFELWQPLHLPPCGLCTTLMQTDQQESSSPLEPLCQSVGDLASTSLLQWPKQLNDAQQQTPLPSTLESDHAASSTAPPGLTTESSLPTFVPSSSPTASSAISYDHTESSSSSSSRASASSLPMTSSSSPVSSGSSNDHADSIASKPSLPTDSSQSPDGVSTIPSVSPTPFAGSTPPRSSAIIEATSLPSIDPTPHYQEPTDSSSGSFSLNETQSMTPAPLDAGIQRAPAKVGSSMFFIYPFILLCVLVLLAFIASRARLARARLRRSTKYSKVGAAEEESAQINDPNAISDDEVELHDMTRAQEDAEYGRRRSPTQRGVYPPSPSPEDSHSVV